MATFFCCCDPDINPLTLKLEGDLDSLKMYIHTENEVARLRHLKLLTVDKICMANEKTRASCYTIGTSGRLGRH